MNKCMDLPVENRFIAECLDLVECEGMTGDQPIEYESNDNV